MLYKSLFVSSVLILSGCSLFSPTPAPAPPPVPMASGLPESSHRGTDIREVQQQLANQGYYKGTVDGTWGPKSAQATVKFQRDNNLPATGVVDSAMLLKLDPENVYHSHGATIPVPLPAPDR